MFSIFMVNSAIYLKISTNFLMEYCNNTEKCSLNKFRHKFSDRPRRARILKTSCKNAKSYKTFMAFYDEFENSCLIQGNLSFIYTTVFSFQPKGKIDYI